LPAAGVGLGVARDEEGALREANGSNDGAGDGVDEDPAWVDACLLSAARGDEVDEVNDIDGEVCEGELIIGESTEAPEAPLETATSGVGCRIELLCMVALLPLAPVANCVGMAEVDDEEEKAVVAG